MTQASAIGGLFLTGDISSGVRFWGKAFEIGVAKSQKALMRGTRALNEALIMARGYEA